MAGRDWFYDKQAVRLDARGAGTKDMGPHPLIRSDKELIVRAARGDTTAFGVLYERYHHTIWRYVRHRVDDTAEADDLTEVVFLKAWEAVAHYQLRDVPFDAWLYRIAHNVVVNRHRLHREMLPLEGQVAALVEDDPEKQVARNESAEAVQQALAQLPPLYREVLTLRFVRGLSHAETARALRRSNDAVRVLQHRALSALRRILDRLTFSGEPRYGADRD
jgi:RNA polymerase sigma-70 factor (ECF subfamily)